MKKKILIPVIAVVAIAAVVCGVIFLGGGSNQPTVEVADSADVLNKVFTTYAEEEKFMAMGGDFNNVKDGEAGIYDMTDADATTSTLHISADLIANVDEAASYIHAMNANTFTAASFHLADAKGTVETFPASLKDSILSTQWMCGFPEHLVMYTVNGEYVVYAIGALDLVENFKAKVATVYGEAATVVFDEAVA